MSNVSPMHRNPVCVYVCVSVCHVHEEIPKEDVQQMNSKYYTQTIITVHMSRKKHRHPERQRADIIFFLCACQ